VAEYDLSKIDTLNANPKSIAALHAEWKRQIAIANTVDSVGVEEADRAVEEAYRIKKLITAQPATTLQEFAMKLLVDTGYGDHVLDDAMVQETRDIVVSIPAAAFAPPAMAVSLPDLIERHSLAIISDQAAWDRVADLVDALTKIKGKYEDDAGYTAALSHAGVTSDAVKALEAEIVAFVPASLRGFRSSILAQGNEAFGNLRPIEVRCCALIGQVL